MCILGLLECCGGCNVKTSEMHGPAACTLCVIASIGIGLGLSATPSRGFSGLSLDQRLEISNDRKTGESLICQFVIHLQIDSNNS